MMRVNSLPPLPTLVTTLDPRTISDIFSAHTCTFVRRHSLRKTQIYLSNIVDLFHDYWMSVRPPSKNHHQSHHQQQQ